MAKELSPAGQKIFLTVFCLVFITVGLSLWIPNFVLPVLDWSARKKWKETPCVIVKSPAGIEEAFDIGFVYRYEFDGHALESSDLGSMGFFALTGDSIRKYKPGSETVCYVDPRPPHTAVLSRDFDPETFVWCAPLLFVLLPGFALIAGLINIGRKKTEEPAPEGALVLANRRGSKGCSLVLQLGFLLFFGGLAALLIYLPGFKESMLIRLVYLVPIGLLTLLILKGFIRSLFRTPAPEITLVVTPGEVHPGRMIEVRWETRSVPDKAKSFRISLQGTEGIRVGKSSEEAIFDWIEIAKGGPKDLRRGSSKIHVPETTMPSLTHGSHRIRWVFCVAGEIPGIGIEGEKFEIEIQPAKEKSS